MYGNVKVETTEEKSFGGIVERTLDVSIGQVGGNIFICAVFKSMGLNVSDRIIARFKISPVILVSWVMTERVLPQVQATKM